MVLCVGESYRIWVVTLPNDSWDQSLYLRPSALYSLTRCAMPFALYALCLFLLFVIRYPLYLPAPDHWPSTCPPAGGRQACLPVGRRYKLRLMFRPRRTTKDKEINKIGHERFHNFFE